MTRNSSLVVLVTTLSSWPALVVAQSVAGALQLSVGTDVVTYADNTSKLEVPVTGTSTTHTKTTDWGVSGQNGVYLAAGYGLTDYIMVGGQLAFGGATAVQKPDETSDVERRQSTFGLLVGPKLDIVLAPGATLRPFGGLVAGFSMRNERLSTTSAANVESSIESSLKGVAVAARAGVHWFLVPGFSIDPAVVFDWASLGGHTNSERLDDADTSSSGYSVSLSVSMSGWVPLLSE